MWRLADQPYARRCLDWGVYLAVRLLICVLQAVSLNACVTLSRGLAWFACRVVRIRAAVVEDNLRHALPTLTAAQRRKLTQSMWEHLLLMVCEIAHAPRKIHETNWREHITIKNKQPLVAAMLDPRPIVAVTGHFGNFEMCGYIAGLLGFPTFTVARPLDNPHLNAFLARFRQKTGQFILPSKGSAAMAQNVIERGETLALLGDHFGGPKGCWVQFFNRPASCHKGPAVFALANRAPIIVLYTRRSGKPLQFEMGLVALSDPHDAGDARTTVSEVTQWYNRQLEAMICEAPQQYWWLHRRWKDPPARRRKSVARRVDEGQTRQVRSPAIRASDPSVADR